MKIIIKARFGDNVLFEGEYESTKHAVIDAVSKKADLRGADLRGADLRGADLSGAYLSGADLSGAYLSGAYLSRAYLSGAYLSGAYLSGTKEKPKFVLADKGILQTGMLGSREDYLLAFLTVDAGIQIKAGCFFGSLADFTKAVKEKYPCGQYAAEYKAAIAMIKSVFKARTK